MGSCAGGGAGAVVSAVGGVGLGLRSFVVDGSRGGLMEYLVDMRVCGEMKG